MRLVTRAVQTVVTTLWMRLHGVHCGPVKCRGRQPRISGGGRIRLGSRVGFKGTVTAPSLSTGERGSIRIGDRSFLNEGVTVHSSVGVHIGSHVMIADYAAVYDTDFHELTPGQPVREEAVVIEDDVWIGRGAVVLPGTRIGRGAVVGAGAVVTHDVPPHALVAGNPARVVRELPPFPLSHHRAR